MHPFARPPAKPTKNTARTSTPTDPPTARMKQKTIISTLHQAPKRITLGRSPSDCVFAFFLFIATLTLLSSPILAQTQAPATPEALAAAQQKLPQAAAATQYPALTALLRTLEKSAPTQDTITALEVSQDLAHAAPLPKTTALIHYTVPAMAPAMRLPGAFPADGQALAPVSIIAAQDEYEPASFLLYSFQNIDTAQLSVSELKNASGESFPKEDLDLKVVKVWYQNANAWFSYFSDVGLTLVPELLLHDENLIRVDTQSQANYARIQSAAGPREVWISAPNEIAVPFNHYDPGFVDAPSLKPVKLEAGRFKQFILTARTTAQTPPGLYKGVITVQSPGQADYTLPVTLKILPFTLPAPKAYLDLKKDFIVSLMGNWPDLPISHPAYLPTLKNLRRHNLLHTGPGGAPTAALSAQYVPGIKAAGFDTSILLMRHSLPWEGTHDGAPFTFDQLMNIRRASQSWRTFFMTNFGHTNAYLCLGDEPTAAWVMKTRQVWRVVQEAGLKAQLAGHEHLYAKAGYILDLHQSAGSPDQGEHARQRQAIGHGHIGFYANQHNGSENPDFVRRQHGLQGYLAGLSAVDNYEFAYGPWNDRATPLYKPMVLAYPISDGLVDTLAWEGFREAIDDIRYATKLKQLAQQAIDSGTADGDLTRVYAGRQTLQWLTLLDGSTVDLASARLEMIGKILKLSALKGS